MVLWVKLHEAEYKRTIQGLYYALQRIGIYKKAPSKKKENGRVERSHRKDQERFYYGSKYIDFKKV